MMDREQAIDVLERQSLYHAQGTEYDRDELGAIVDALGIGQPDPEVEPPARVREAARKVVADVDSSVATADLPATHTLKINVEELRSALDA